MASGLWQGSIWDDAAVLSSPVKVDYKLSRITTVLPPYTLRLLTVCLKLTFMVVVQGLKKIQPTNLTLRRPQGQPRNRRADNIRPLANSALLENKSPLFPPTS